MPVDFRISDLPTSIPFNNLDIMEVSQVDSESPSGYSSVKKTMEEIGEKLLNDIQYASALNTTDKKIIGAINEVNNKGLKDLSDTNITNPSNGQTISYDGSKWVNTNTTTEDITSQVTWNENVTGTNTKVYVKNNVVYLNYQGESTTHSSGDVLFTLPSGYRPLNLLYTPFVVNGLTFGNFEIAKNGTAKINQINDNTATGRIYATVAFPIV